MWLKHIIPYFNKYEVSKEISGNKFRARLFFQSNSGLKVKSFPKKNNWNRDDYCDKNNSYERGIFAFCFLFFLGLILFSFTFHGICAS